MEAVEKGSYRNLIVWQKAMDLVDAVYDLTARRSFGKNLDFSKADILLNEIMRMLNAMLR